MFLGFVQYIHVHLQEDDDAGPELEEADEQGLGASSKDDGEEEEGNAHAQLGQDAEARPRQCRLPQVVEGDRAAEHRHEAHDDAR